MFSGLSRVVSARVSVIAELRSSAVRLACNLVLFSAGILIVGIRTLGEGVEAVSLTTFATGEISFETSMAAVGSTEEASLRLISGLG